MTGNILAVIPARAGSKGLPGKNLLPLHGRSLTARAILTARNVSLIHEVVISTDGEDIAAEARTHGAHSPFMRPAELSGDTARSHDMWKHAWEESEKYFARTFAVAVLLEPTSPLRRAQDVAWTLETLLNSDTALAAATVSPTPGQYTPEKTLKLDSGGYLSYYAASGKEHSLRQSIPSYFHRNGICYALRREALFEHGSIIEQRCLPVVIDRPIANIDTQADLDYADFLIHKYGDPLTI